MAPGAPYNIIKLRSSAHRELSMRTDKAPFTDPRVRQAIALTLDRPAIVQALFKGDSDLGNDSPFAPVFPSTNTSQYDKLVKQYVAAHDLSSQRSVAGQIETLLLNETPIIFAYFYNYLSATAKSVGGVYPTAIGHVFLNKATKA